MKLYLEKEIEKDIEGIPTTVLERVKEVTSKAEAILSKVNPGKNKLHYCYHDEDKPRPCKMEDI